MSQNRGNMTVKRGNWNSDKTDDDSIYSLKDKSQKSTFVHFMSKKKKKKKFQGDSETTGNTTNGTLGKLKKHFGAQSNSNNESGNRKSIGKRRFNEAFNEEDCTKRPKVFKFFKSKSQEKFNERVSGTDENNLKLSTNASSKILPDYDNILRQRFQLPIAKARDNLVLQVQKNTSIIFIGETACGKTTQVPQFLHEVRMERGGMIGVTQPRRVAAITIAERVAQETETELGQLVGYTVRFEDVTSGKTKIKYMTDGMLLREAMSDPLLRRYSIIILDEAHERTIHTDVLFGVVKYAQKARSETLSLKMVIMSATMDVDHFSRYFNNAPVFHLQGRQHPVQVNHLEEAEPDYVYAALRTIFQIHKDQPQGDILVFCTGQEEIESMSRTIRQTAKHLTSDQLKMQVCPMYAALPSAAQLSVFQSALPGHRKVILATNIAETSLTICGIKYVIDSGKVKARIYNPSTGLNLLTVQNVSKAQAWQRTGRAGRQSRGKCYRLYTEEELQLMRLQSIPEIQRCHLSSVVLELLTIGVENVVNFDFMDKPSPKLIDNAIDELKLLDAVNDEEPLKLTLIGKRMANFPLDPKYSKIILSSKQLGCTEEILSVVAMLSVESVFFGPNHQKERYIEVRKRYSSSEGDHISMLNIFRTFKSVTKKKEWCAENFIHHRNMKMAIEIRKQLAEVCQRTKIPLKSCGQDSTPVRKCIATGMFKNAAELCSDGSYLALDSRQKVRIHPSSCLFKCKPAYVVFNEMVKTTKCYMRDLCVVDPDWLHQAAPTFFRNKFLPHDRSQ